MPLKYGDMQAVLTRSILMVRDYLMENVYHDSDPDELAEEWTTIRHHVVNLTQGKALDMEDLMTLLGYTQVDFGIVIRDPVTHKEVVFFTADNLASNHAFELQTESIQRYGSDKKGDEDGYRAVEIDMDAEGIDFLPEVHPKAMDGDFNVDKEIGSDEVEKEFREINRNDVERLIADEDVCEACLDYERVSGSMLCNYCIKEGIICREPEEDTPGRDPLELIASINQQEEHASHQVTRLLKAGGMLDDEVQ